MKTMQNNWEVETQLEEETKQAEASSKELQGMLEWLKMLLQGRDAQVSATVT